MFFKQFKVEGIGCLSYLIGCPGSGEAVVIDPKRDVEEYIEVAEENGMIIKAIIETHIHADHISGAQELASKTGANIYIGGDPDIKYSHFKIKENDKLEFGNVLLSFLETPGHTPYSISILVTDKSRSDKPEMILTGDLLFVGSIGRPDLAGKEILEEQVKNLYNSLQKIISLPDYLEVYPAHGEGSLCGSGISGKSSSTIGFEKATNKILNLSFEDFKKEITSSFPHRPKNFTYIIKTNKEGAKLLKELPKLKHFYVNEIKNFIKSGGVIIDLRDATSFGGAHIPGSINIGLTDKSPNWLGSTVEPDKKIMLVANSLQDINKALILFRRVGYDNIIGYTIGINSWILAGEDTGFLPQISIHSLKHVLEKYGNHNVIDVRSEEEWNSGHIKDAIHIPLEKLIDSEIDLELEDHISIICGSGYRSNIAGSILKTRGYKNVYSVIGGMTAWKRKFKVDY